MPWKTTPTLLTVAAVTLLAMAPAVGEEAPAAARIAAVELLGGADPPERLRAYVETIAPRGDFFVEAGDADRVGDVRIGTVPRLRDAMALIGYDAVVEVRPAGGDTVRLVIHLRAYDRVRHIFISGNGRLRQEEIIRRLSIRPGQSIPFPGPEREAFLAQERNSVREYLLSQGYLDADVNIVLRGTSDVPSRINLNVDLALGPGYPVGPVEVKGNTAFSDEDVEDTFHHGDWRWLWLRPLPFRLRLLRDDVTKLEERYRDRGYTGARVQTDFDPQRSIDRKAKVVRLGVTINERKRIEVVFEGNDSRSDDALRGVLPIFERGGLADYDMTASAAAIAADYRERGYIFAKVRWRREPLDPSADRIVFTVDEGPALKVRGVEFLGNRAFNAETLREVVRTKVYPPFGFLGIGEGGYASPRQLTLDVETLVEFYAANGFPEAKVRSEMSPTTTDWRPTRTITPSEEAIWRKARSLHVRFIIEEGPEERISEIRFETVGKAPLPLDETFLRKSLLTIVGAPYRQTRVREDVGRLTRLLGDAGHPRGTAEPLATRDEGKVTIVWQIDPGPKVHVGPVFVRGNFLTREQTVLQWVRLKPGSLLTTTEVERSQRDLALVQLFNNANPIRFPSEGPNDTVVPMVIEVEERHDHWGVVRIGGGASTEQVAPGSDLPVDVYASAGYEHRNLFGRGWTFDSQGAYGKSVARVNASFLDPRFFGSMFRMEVAANYLSQATVRLGDLRSGGGSIGFAREMYPGVDAFLRYSLRNTLRTEFLLSVAGPFEEQKRVQIGTVVGSLSTGLEWLRLDNPLLPTRGFRVSAAVELAHPSLSMHVGEDTFVKAVGRALVVVPLTRWLSVRNSVRYDHGFPMGSSLLPKVERFFAGGDTTVRGFELDRARSEAILSPVARGAVTAQYRPVGGSIRVLHNLDLQFPIAPPLYGAVFLDNGVVADSLIGVRPAAFRHGVGVSPLLLRLPIGDISVSWAWPLDPQPGDSRTGRLHFNVGLMF